MPRADKKNKCGDVQPVLYGLEVGMRKYSYFVSVVYYKENNVFGFTNFSITNQPKIKNIDDLESLQNRIMKKENFKNVVILNYRIF